MSSPTPFEFLLVSNNYKTLCAVTEGIKPFGARLGFVPAADSARDYKDLQAWLANREGIPSGPVTPH